MAGEVRLRRRSLGLPSLSAKAPGRPWLPLGDGVWQRLWPAVLLWLAVVYYLVNIRLPRVQSAAVSVYLAQPATWASFGVLAYLGWRFGLRDRPRFRIGLTAMAALTGGFQVALFLLAGLVFGFGQTPYSRAPLALLGNLVYMLSMLLAVEIGRAYLVVFFSRGSPLVSIGSMTLLFAWIGIPYARYGAVSDIEPLFQFSGGTLLPALSQNLLACFLALHGGPMASLAYRVVLEAFEWLSPILPNLSWTMQAFVGTIAPALGLLLVRGGLGAHTTRREARAAEGTTSFVLIASLAVALLWFNTGMFGIRPTLVSGVSMEPALRPGDIVIVQPVSAESLRVGDIVRFRDGSTTILHRLVEIRGSGPDWEFLTQGDANNVPDRPVTEGEVEGRVILILPKIGWLAIGVRQLIGWFR